MALLILFRHLVVLVTVCWRFSVIINYCATQSFFFYSHKNNQEAWDSKIENTCVSTNLIRMKQITYVIESKQGFSPKSIETLAQPLKKSTLIWLKFCQNIISLSFSFSLFLLLSNNLLNKKRPVKRRQRQGQRVAVHGRWVRGCSLVPVKTWA